MKQFFLWILLGVMSLGLASCQMNSVTTELKVAASIFPVYDITRNIAGNEIEVVQVLPPGASPHTFSPDPALIQKLAGSRAVFMIGHGLDGWAENIATAAEIQEAIVVDRDVNLLMTGLEHEHDETEDHQHEAIDPHYWLSVKEARNMARQVRDELQRLFPEQTAEIEENYQRYDAELLVLDQEISSHIEAMENPKIATFHNAWAYFERDHGVEIVATFEEFPGEEPSVQYLAEFQKQIREHQVGVIFAEPQFSTATLEPIAADLGVVIATLNPVEGGGESESYVSLMRQNVERISEYRQ